MSKENEKAIEKDKITDSPSKVQKDELSDADCEKVAGGIVKGGTDTCGDTLHC